MTCHGARHGTWLSQWPSNTIPEHGGLGGSGHATGSTGSNKGQETGGRGGELALHPSSNPNITFQPGTVFLYDLPRDITHGRGAVANNPLFSLKQTLFSSPSLPSFFLTALGLHLPIKH